MEDPKVKTEITKGIQKIERATHLHRYRTVSDDFLTRFRVVELEVADQGENEKLHFQDGQGLSDTVMRTRKEAHDTEGRIVVLWKVEPSFRFD